MKPLLTESWRWKSFQYLNGYSIREMVEGEDGTFWISSQEGILSYDGYRWQEHEGLKKLSSEIAERIMVAGSRTYAVNGEGIFVYEEDQWRVVLPLPESIDFDFAQFKLLEDGTTLAAATNWGLLLLKNDELAFVTSQPKASTLAANFPKARMILLPYTPAEDFLFVTNVLDTESSLWLALNRKEETGELFKLPKTALANGKISVYERWSDSESLPLGEGQKLLMTETGQLWVVNNTSNKGLAIYEGGQWQTHEMNTFFGGDEYMSDIVQTEDGTIWIGSLAALISYRDGQWNKYRSSDYPIPANRLILEKGSGNQLWIAGYRSDMIVLDMAVDQQFSYLHLSFHGEDRKGNQWFVEKNGKVVVNRQGRWEAYSISDGLIDAPVSLLCTSQGQVWVGGSHRGVAATALLKDGKWQRHIHRSLSWSIDYRSLFEASDGTLWFGASVDGESSKGFYSGLLELKDPTAEQLEWKQHRAGDNGLNQFNVYGIAESPDGHIWIGGSALLYYDGSSWRTVAEEKLRQYVNVVANTEDLVIAGSRCYGIFIYDGKGWTNYTTSDGLASNTVISIDAISNTEIVVATDKGICKFDGTGWINDFFPEDYDMDFEGGSILHMNKNTFWLNFVPRGWKRRAYQEGADHGEAWEVATVRYTADSLPPETRINFYQDVVSAQGNTLISWTGQDYFSKTPIDRLSYSYKFDDGQWSPYSLRTQFSFANLGSGTHQLSVRARDHDFNIDPTPAVVVFEVLAPVWQRPWFIAMILSFLLLYGIYEYRIISEKRKLQVLNSNLQEVNIQLNERRKKVKAQNKEILRQQEQIIKQSQALELSNEDLEMRNAEIVKQKNQLEELVRQIENLSKAKVNFFTNISHELRTPLSLILGPIEQLRNEGLQLTEKQKKTLYSLLNKNALRLLKLINQLLEIRRIEHSSLEVNLSNVDVNSCVEEVAGLFNALALRRNIELKTTAELPHQYVALDMDKFEKVIVNLLSNAFKYTPDGGTIELRLCVEEAVSKGASCLLEPSIKMLVKDTGTGIAEDQLTHIFEQFYTTDDQDATQGNSGIGLTYVRDLVYLMEGKIEVDSSCQGTCFSVYLPYMPVVAASELVVTRMKTSREEVLLLLGEEEQPEKRAEIPREKLSSILIVEDNQDMRNFLESVLHGSYNLYLAADGLEGLRIAEKFDIDLIISDVMMPNMDGFTFLENIRNNFNTSHIPTVLLTAKALEENKLTGFVLGTDAYLTKPVKVDMLLLRIENLLKRTATLRKYHIKEYIFTPKPEQIVTKDEELLHTLAKAMEENYGDPEFNVDAMCKLVFLSHMHFIRKVKQLTGKKPVDLLKAYRMEKAKDLLKHSDLAIAQVAYRVGFEAPNSFSRAFKKEFKITPTQFIARHKRTSVNVS